jgi:hypothetical protein
VRAIGRAGLAAQPRTVAFAARPASAGWRATREIVLRNLGTRSVTARLDAGAPAGVAGRVTPARLTLARGEQRTVRLSLRSRPGTRPRPGLAGGVLTARGAQLRLPWLVPLGRPDPPPLGRIALTRREGRVTGARFSVGAFDRGDPGRTGARLAAAERLTLELVDTSGRRVATLTPRGGAPELLPGVYAYTLPAATLRRLPDGRFRFRARAVGPRGGPAATVLSPPFAR